MPRQIIDTESSRPAYQRRLAIRWIVGVVLVIILGFVAFTAWKASHPAPANLGLLSQKVGVP
jgi:hypothetical protein